MDKKEEILNLVLQHLDNISDEELYNAFIDSKKHEIIPERFNVMTLEIKGIKINLREYHDIFNYIDDYYSIEFYYNNGLIIEDKRIQIYFDRLKKYINKINIEKENQNIDNILSRLKS